MLLMLYRRSADDDGNGNADDFTRIGGGAAEKAIR